MTLITYQQSLSIAEQSHRARTEKLCSAFKSIHGINIDTSKILLVGPRNEGELLLFRGHGFKKSNIEAIDLFSYSSSIKLMDMNDLKEGQKLEGTVRNVVDFGAFIDLGVKQDGLLHISNMSLTGRRIDNPHDVVGVGDIITVEVVMLDLERGRIGLKLV